MMVKMIIALIFAILVYMFQINIKLFFTLPVLENGLNLVDVMMIAYFSYILSRLLETIIKGEKFVVDFHLLLSFVIIMLANSLNVMFALVALYILFYYLAGYISNNNKIVYFLISLIISVLILVFQNYIVGLYNNFIPEYTIQYTALFLLVLSLLYNNIINAEFILLMFILLFGPTNILSVIIILIYFIVEALNFLKNHTAI
jgi:hypothetical protein